MQLISLLDPKLIYFDEHSGTKVEAIRSLVDKLCKHFKMKICDRNLYDLLIKREMESSTVYPTGLAIPHVRLDDFNDTVIGVSIPKLPITDGDNPVKIIFLIITGKGSTKLYLNVVASLMKMSKDPAIMKGILSCENEHDVFNIIKKEDYTVKEDLTIRDVMVPNPFTVRETATIREMADIVFTNNITNLPVVDAEGNFIGEVDILQYLKVGVPDYLMLMTNLKFLHSYEPLEQLFLKEGEVLIRDIMTPPELTLYPDNSLIEAVFKMIQNNKRFFTVTENRKVVGIITAMDIFRKVVRS